MNPSNALALICVGGGISVNDEDLSGHDLIDFVVANCSAGEYGGGIDVSASTVMFYKV
jgi:hypothetical protein